MPRVESINCGELLKGSVGTGGGENSGMISMSNCETSDSVMLRYVGRACSISYLEAVLPFGKLDDRDFFF